MKRHSDGMVAVWAAGEGDALSGLAREVRALRREREAVKARFLSDLGCNDVLNGFTESCSRRDVSPDRQCGFCQSSRIFAAYEAEFGPLGTQGDDDV